MELGVAPKTRPPAGDGERQARLDVAAACRLADRFGWSDLLASHISARVPGRDEFLVNPYGLLFEQVTATSLIRVDMQGNVLDPTEHVLNPGAFVVHSALYRDKPWVGAVVHLHTRDGVAVSTQQDGLLPVTQHALVIWHQLAYHEYEGVATDIGECARISAAMGERKLLILRNHGTLSAGVSVAEAFAMMYRLERACRTQIAAQSGGVPLRPIAAEVAQRSVEQGRQIFSKAGFAPSGELEWRALMRKVAISDPDYRD
jgi:ribulose-5-phosphate 4-epimerase/fuculose-1-phosphate aldolase